MADVQNDKDYLHPQYRKDRETLNTALVGGPSSLNMAEVARLRIRYDGFQGARDIQRDLDKVLQTWNLTEDELFAKTRALHKTETIFTPTWIKKGEDWS